MKYRPKIEWSKSWVFNLFRVFEQLFGASTGVLQTSAFQSRKADGTIEENIVFHTWEAALVHFEYWVRNKCTFKPFKIYIPQLSTPQGVSFQSPYLFAIAYDTSGNAYTYPGNTATVTLAATGSDRLAVMFTLTGAASPFTSMTVDGNNATAIVSNFVPFGTQALYGLTYVAPPTSSVNYVYTRPVDPTNDMELGVLTYSGVNQSTTPDSSATGTGTTTLTLTTTVVASNCWLVSCHRDNGGTANAGSGTTRRQVGTSLTTGDSNGTVGTGSQSMGWDGPGSSAGGIIFSLQPPVAAGPANLKSYNTNVLANIKSISTNLIANVKSINTNT